MRLRPGETLPPVRPRYTGRLSTRVRRLRRPHVYEGSTLHWEIRLPDYGFYYFTSWQTPPLQMFELWVAEQLGGLRRSWQVDRYQLWLVNDDVNDLIEAHRHWLARSKREDETLFFEMIIRPQTLVGVEFAQPDWVYVGKDFVQRSHRTPDKGGDSRV